MADIIRSTKKAPGYTAVFVCRGAPGLGRVTPSVALVESWRRTMLSEFLFISYLTGARYLESLEYPLVDLGRYADLESLDEPYVEEITDVLSKCLEVIEAFKPDVLVSDGMLYTPLFAKEFGIPTVAIANTQYLYNENKPKYLIEQALHNVCDIVLAQDLQWETYDKPFSFTTQKTVTVIPPIVKEASQLGNAGWSKDGPHIVISLGGGAVKAGGNYLLATQRLQNNLLLALSEICSEGLVKAVTVLPCYGIEVDITDQLHPCIELLDKPVELVEILQTSDMIISRAGRNTLAEILVHRGRGLVFPRSDSLAYEQTRNANAVATLPNIRVMSENEVTATSLKTAIKSLLGVSTAADAPHFTSGNKAAIRLIESVLAEHHR